MRLKVKFLKWSAGTPVVILHKDTALNLGVHIEETSRISIKKLNYSQEIIAVANIIGGTIKKNEIMVSSEIKERLNLKENQIVEVNLAESSFSLNLIKKKLNNKKLSQKDIEKIISDIVKNNLSEAEISLFVSSMYKYGMDIHETINLIKAILKFGKILRAGNYSLADKHSIGGIPGNRTTPIVVSICSAAGLIMPKSSSRAITSAAGTADVIEVLARVEFSIPELKKILKKVGAFLVWEGNKTMVPADSKIIRIEKKLNIDPESQLLASIMSKKIAAGSKYILIDIPYGKTAKVNKSKALSLKRKFEYIGKYFKKKLKVVLTDGSQPIGNGIGPALEMADVLKVLDPSQFGPKDLKNKAIFLAGQLLELANKVKKGQGKKKAEEILSSGQAFNKFKEIIEAQGGSIPKKLIFGEYKHDILSSKSGRVIEINNYFINLLARSAGCPLDKYSGVYLYVHKGDKVKNNQKILTIYAQSKLRLKEAINFYKENEIIKIV